MDYAGLCAAALRVGDIMSSRLCATHSRRDAKGSPRLSAAGTGRRAGHAAPHPRPEGPYAVPSVRALSPQAQLTHGPEGALSSTEHLPARALLHPRQGPRLDLCPRGADGRGLV